MAEIMAWIGWLRTLLESLLAWVRGPPPPPTIANDGAVVSKLDINIKKTKNITAKIETESGSNNCPPENNVGQGPQADYTASGGGVIRIDKVCVDEVDGDLDFSVCTKKTK